jgi:HEAT repeat protein
MRGAPTIGWVGLVLLSLAAAARGQADANAHDAAVKALQDEDDYRRLTALQTIGNRGNPARSAVPEVLALLKTEKNRDVRAQAGKTLSQIGAPALEGLIGALADPSADVRFTAAQALARFGPDAADAVPALAARLADDAAGVRAAAAAALGEIGPRAQPALPALADVLQDATPVRNAALRALAQIGSPSVPILRAGLRSRKTATRSGCAFALGVLGAEAEPAVPELVQLVQHDSEPKVRSTAVAALGAIGPAAREAVPALARCLKDPDRMIEYQATQALAAIGPEDVPALVELLKDENARVRAEAIFLLGQWGAGAKSAVPALMNALNDREPTNRSLAALSLGHMGPDAKAALTRLRDLRWSKRSDPTLHLAVTIAEARIQPGDRQAEKLVQEEVALQRKLFPTPVGVVATQNLLMEMAQLRQSVLEWAESEKAGRRELLAADAPILRQKLGDGDSQARLAVLRVVAVRRLRLENEVISCLNDPDPRVRNAAWQTLVRLARGTDLGPTRDATPKERVAAQERWRQWWSRQDPDPHHTAVRMILLPPKDAGPADAGPR